MTTSNGWQPIATAPKDGTPIDALASKWLISGTFSTRFEKGRWVFHCPGDKVDGSPYEPLFKEWVPFGKGWKPVITPPIFPHHQRSE